MKIAIQGHPIRGKEVIQILESLGGKNNALFKGVKDFWYFIDSDGHIRNDYQIVLIHAGFRTYTLEEFEKAFPFKIGDEVIFPVKVGWTSGKITGLTYVGDQLKYEVDNRIAGYRYIEPHKLSLYPMKEERNITLTLEKAKEWYKKGGELREIALQAFTEKELNLLPKSWEEYCRKYKFSCLSTRYSNFPLKYDALFKLEQLRDCWRQGWKPDWLDGNTKKYAIKGWRDKNSIEITCVTHAFLSFPTYELALEFQECFKDLIEQAGDLI